VTAALLEKENALHLSAGHVIQNPNLYGRAIGIVHLRLLFHDSYRDWPPAFGQQPMANN